MLAIFRDDETSYFTDYVIRAGFRNDLALRKA